MNDFFNTLGIEATKEEKKIKKAYRARLHAVNPEDDPDGFKRLREAYEEALKYARQKEEEPENPSPAEEFISRCEQLYKDFYRRIDEQEWEKLFSEDICISLESGEEVRQRFLVFLMENFRLPSPVWKKILPAAVKSLSSQGIRTYAAHLNGKNVYDEEDYTEGCAFLIGNEGNGLRDEVSECADCLIRIPMCGKAESLNAAVAAAVLMFEAGRQRRK